MVTPKSFEIRVEAVPEAGPGEVLLETIYLSVDPYMRGRISGQKSYAEPFPLDSVMQGGGIGRVVKSQADGYQVGDLVQGLLPWADHATLKGARLRKLTQDTPPTASLHVLGMTGLTAYFGLLEVAGATHGETVVVSAAAGAVGSVVGQLAQIIGCRVIGITGSEAKCRVLRDEFSFDEALNYRTGLVRESLSRMAPEGVDVYFDNVGGLVTDAVLGCLGDGARIAVCGQIALYNQAEAPPTPVLSLLLNHRAMARGFIVGDFAEQHEVALEKLSAWYREGRIHTREHIVDGLEHAPDALIGLFHGDNIGKQLVQVQAL